MTFELIEKSFGTREGLKGNVLSVCQTGIGFSKEALSFLNKRYVEIYIDRDENRIGFKATDNILTGFSLYTKDTPRINTNSIKDMVPLGRYEYFIEEGMLVIYVKLRGLNLKKNESSKK